LGAWLAFELARELRRRSLRAPELLVVAASRAPHWRSAESPIHRLSDDQFLTELERRFDGIPLGVRDSSELLQHLLPLLRDDMQMVETYEYAAEPPLDINLLALGGAQDEAVSPAQLAAWQRHTSRDFSLRLVPGGHFFLFDSDRERASSNSAHPPRLSPAMRMIVNQLERCLPASAFPFKRND
jgi:medium-chain acyl-[acyl-carrier-protein] hydrolase